MHSTALCTVLAILVPCLALGALPHRREGQSPPAAGPHAALPPEPLRYSSAAESHRVQALPGYGKLPVHMFAGNFSVAPGRELFYVFVEAQDRPKEAPVVLWLTGGPGCSSVGSAWIGEHGPFFPRPGSARRLVRNPHSFHRFAHMIYLDTPAFVGFSRSNHTGDHCTGDEPMARDNLAFIQAWMAAYYSLASNPFWLAGESYAGHYVPALTKQILQHNERVDGGGGGLAQRRVNFKGYLLGNPSTDPEYDNSGRVDYWWSHGLTSEDVSRKMRDSCNFSNVILGPADEVHVHETGSACKDAIKDALAEMGGINIQGIFLDKCMQKGFDAEEGAGAGASWRGALQSLGGWAAARAGLHTWGKSEFDGEALDPCITKEGELYLARRDVQDALHANVSGQLSWPYSGCAPASLVNYSTVDQLRSQLPLLREIMTSHPELRLLVYTGDTDALVPLTGTRRWAYDLGLELHKERKTRWSPWEDEEGQVGGWIEEYRHFTYLTIRHASHEAPYTAKRRTAYVYKTWLSGEELV